jgi:serine/threonine protein kinase
MFIVLLFSIFRLFKKEAALLHTIRGNENVPFLIAFNEPSNSILMAYYEFSFRTIGIDKSDVCTLHDYLATYDELDETQKKNLEPMLTIVVRDVATAMRFLHSHDIVHRDLKPENILVTNQHYASCDPLELPQWLACQPVIAVVTDFGESRSALLQTLNCVAYTARVFRGSLAFMAPENINNNNIANIASMKQSDVWSFAMVMFCVLNPARGNPYEFELETAEEREENSEKALVRLFSKKTLPQHDDINAERHAGSWAPFVRLYEACAQFEPHKRPPMDTALRDLICDIVRIDSLPISQSSASEELSRIVLEGGREQCSTTKTTNNACTSLAVLIVDRVCSAAADFSVADIATDAMLHFPTIDKRPDDICENIPQACARLLDAGAIGNLSFDVVIESSGPISQSAAKNELCMALYKYFSCDVASSFNIRKCAIYVVTPYTFVICLDSDGQVCIIDTHAVQPSCGGKGNGVIVTAGDTVRRYCDIMQWLFIRVPAKDKVQHELACIKDRQFDVSSRAREEQMSSIARHEELLSTAIAVDHDVEPPSLPPPSRPRQEHASSTVRQREHDVEPPSLQPPSLPRQEHASSTVRQPEHDVERPSLSPIPMDNEMSSANHIVRDRMMDRSEVTFDTSFAHAVSTRTLDRSCNTSTPNAREMIDVEGDETEAYHHVEEVQSETVYVHSSEQSGSEDEDSNDKNNSSTSKIAPYLDFAMSNWDDCEAEFVEEIPYAIDGMHKYVLQCESSKEMMTIGKDGRPWARWNTSSR